MYMLPRISAERLSQVLMVSAHAFLVASVWLTLQSFFLATSGLSEEQQQMYKLAVDFAHQEMRPNMAVWDEKVDTVW